MAQWTTDSKKAVCGYMVCLLSMVLNVGSLGCIQTLQGTIPSFELYSIRFATQSFLSVPHLVTTGCDITVKQSSKLWMCVGCVLQYLVSTTYITSPELVPLGTFKALALSSELLVLSLIALCWFGERRWHIFASVMTCIVGTLLILQPFGSAIKPGDAADMQRNTTNTAVTNGGLVYPSVNNKSHAAMQPSNISAHQGITTTAFSIYNYSSLASGTMSSTLVEHGQILPNDTVPAILATKSSQSVVMSSHILGCMLSVGCGVSYSLYFVDISHKLADIPGTVLSFWTSVSGLFVSAVVSLSMETITWPNTWQGNALLMGFAVPYGKLKIWKW